MKKRRGIFFILCCVLAIFFVDCSGEKHAAKSAANNDDVIRKKYAGILGVNEKEIANIALYKFIDDWYGTPYVYGGKTKSGVDCSGFVCNLYSNVYKKTISGSAASLNDACEKVSEKNLKEGDLIFFKINSKTVSHVGVYLQNRHFVHASSHHGVIINSLDEAYYTKYFFRGGRLK
ncbi:MAG: C40 family peptidase [Bacteroidetes bacterium]|nr:C40 family peptidase [Bacteroidota bacterium]